MNLLVLDCPTTGLKKISWVPVPIKINSVVLGRIKMNLILLSEFKSK